MPLILYDSLWNTHVVAEEEGGTALLYIATGNCCARSAARRPSPRCATRTAARIALPPHLAVADHAIPTQGRAEAIADLQARSISHRWRDALINGWDEIALIKTIYSTAIAQFEAGQRTTQHWLRKDNIDG